MRTCHRTVPAACLVALAAACHPTTHAGATATGDQADPECRAAAGELDSPLQAHQLAGRYRLRLVTSRGPRAGDSADAVLELQPPPDDSLEVPPPLLGIGDSTTRHPLIGWTGLESTAVGAVPTGALDSRDPRAPGVLVIEHRPSDHSGQRQLTLRLGAEATRRDRVRYDGGYFAMTVRRIEPAGFAGTWVSGARTVAAEGYFCAARAPS